MFKKLSSEELQNMSPKDLERYQLELMKHEKFDVGEYLEHNKAVDRSPNNPLYRPSLVDEEVPEKGWTVYGVVASEFTSFKDVTIDEIVSKVKEELAQGEVVGEIGTRPPLEFHMYKATLEGVKGYKQLIRGHFSLKESRIGFRITNIRLGRSGIHIDFVPHGPLAETTQRWIDDRKVSFRCYPRLGYNTELKETFICFDLDKENLMP